MLVHSQIINLVEDSISQSIVSLRIPLMYGKNSKNDSLKVITLEFLSFNADFQLETRIKTNFFS